MTSAPATTDAALSPDRVRRIARLARLALTEEEVARFTIQLASILRYVSELQTLDTGDVEPTSHPLAVVAPLREDAPLPSLPRDQALAAAPDADRAAGLFKVPRVLGA